MSTQGERLLLMLTDRARAIEDPEWYRKKLGKMAKRREIAPPAPGEYDEG